MTARTTEPTYGPRCGPADAATATRALPRRRVRGRFFSSNGTTTATSSRERRRTISPIACIAAADEPSSSAASSSESSLARRAGTMASRAGLPAVRCSSLKATAACEATARTPVSSAISTAGARTGSWSTACAGDAAAQTSASPRHTPMRVSSEPPSKASTSRGTNEGMTRSPIFCTTSPSVREPTRCLSAVASSSGNSSSDASSPSESSSAGAGCCGGMDDEGKEEDWSTYSGVSIATKRRTSAPRISLSARGVFGTTVFHTCTAECRTAAMLSRRAMYRDARMLRHAALPMAFSIAFAVASSPSATSSSPCSA
mmetsp:Transcript_19909/g.61610  ORF Transcript_19909/g.61610 Transcript_19909/m.61610 type:complete len:315 (+) Transcript_19909:3231-4175(+)